MPVARTKVSVPVSHDLARLKQTCPNEDFLSKLSVMAQQLYVLFDKHGRERKSGFQFKTKPGAGKQIA
jgi:hypothetical protein